jgi:hypothetical protein
MPPTEALFEPVECGDEAQYSPVSVDPFNGEMVCHVPLRKDNMFPALDTLPHPYAL